MTTTVPAIRGSLGNTEFYETTMKVGDLVKTVRPPKEIDGWANFSIEERMQREPDLGRIKSQLAPYIAKNADRFFGSIIVLVYKGEITFESLADVAKNIPNAYKKNAERVGFVTIDGGILIVLDGQHRLLALEMVNRGDVPGEFANDVANDEICVIFINHEGDIKTRRIFNTVNRYAKQTSRGDNIITSEDDGYAIVTRWLLREGAPLGKPANIVNWKSNTLVKRSTQLTTISAVYETVRLILRAHQIEKLPEQERPSDEDLDMYLSFASDVWDQLLQGMPAFQAALADPSKIPVMREDDASTALLFKPAAQIALVDGLLRAVDMTDLKIGAAIARAAKITSWSMNDNMWNGMIVKRSGTIDAGPDARRRMAGLLSYLIAGDKLDEESRFAVWRMFNEARSPDDFSTWVKSDGAKGKVEDLPKPVEGAAYTVQDALGFAEKSGVFVDD
jgi:DNA sulfur modification protein DndB